MSASTLRDRLRGERLYVITPDLEPDTLVARTEQALVGGARIVQLRHKTLARARLLDLARELRRLTAAAGALLIVNDHLDIALLAGADGVHLGHEDLSVAAARRVAGSGLIIGATAAGIEPALAAARDGADYVGCGAAFPTPVKPGRRAIGPAAIAAVAAASPIPVFAIGGIDAANLDQLLAAGLRRVCVVRAVYESTDPRASASALAARLAAAGDA